MFGIGGEKPDLKAAGKQIGVASLNVYISPAENGLGFG